MGKNQTTMTGESETEEGEIKTKETLVIEIDKNPKRTTASDREQEIQPEPKKTEKENRAHRQHHWRMEIQEN